MIADPSPLPPPTEILPVPNPRPPELDLNVIEGLSNSILES